MGERKSVRIVPYEERKPLYAAYAAAHAEAERIGGTLSDDLIVQAAVKAYEKALFEAGRLLPSGGEVSTQFAALGFDRQGRRMPGLVVHHSLAAAQRWKERLEADRTIGKVSIAIHQRQAHIWEDGSEHYTPWSPVVSDNTDETQWAIRDADGNTGDYATDEREIRRSWAQGITWYDPDGSYELCRRGGPDAPWEVVERHPVVSDNSEGESSG